jgi:hypothetical protein
MAVLIAGGLAGGALAAFTSSTTPVSIGVGSGSLAAPTGLTAACVALSNHVTLNWTATTSTIAQGYAVLRATTSGGPYTPIGTTGSRTTTTFTDTIGALATQYYVVHATLHSWTSPDSNQAGVTSLALGVCSQA